jgi:FkbM family methyltransferase
VTRYRPMVDELMVPVAEIPPQDVRPWETVLGRLLSDAGHYRELSARARATALDYARGLDIGPFEAYLLDLLRAPRRSREAVRHRPPLSGERCRLLARRATALARRSTGLDLEILWDGMWIRRVDSCYFPDPDLFRDGDLNWQHWLQMARQYLRNAEDYWFHVYKPGAGDVIVDIGAGRGEDVYAFSRAVGPEGRVWAIEPHPASFAVLRKFCEWNRLDNVTALDCACTDQPGKVHVEALPVWESSFVRRGGVGPGSYAVEGVRFDDLAAAQGIGRIDFLKMNIEGSERLALPGCREALLRARHVCVAAHDFRAMRGEGEEFRTLEFVKAFLREAGFEVVMREDARYFVAEHVHGRRR